MFKLASSIGFALALADLKRRIRVLVRKGILATIGVVLLLIGLSFLLVALHLWLSGVLSPIASASIIGGALVLIAAILFAIVAWPQRATKRTFEGSDIPLAGAAEDSFSRLGDMLGSGQNILGNRAVQIAGLALVGYLLGRRSRRDDSDDKD